MKNYYMLLGLLIVLAATHVVCAQEKPSTEGRIPSKGMAVMDSKGVFVPYEFTRRPVGDDDILIEILYAGICHSDLHHVWEDWRSEIYPMVPGHEIAGKVVQVGKNVTNFKVGDYAGVGCLVGSCQSCPYCTSHQEQYCKTGVLTYGKKDQYHNDEMTYGGYSNNMVLPANFAINIPADAEIEKVAPLLCAGITTYSPIKYAKVTKDDKVAVAGFGGLGHMAVQYAVALGADVTVFDITEDKRKAALDMGAERYVNVNNPAELEGLDETFRVIISTIPAKYEPKMYLKLLQLDGDFIVLGLPPTKDMPSLDLATILFSGRRKIYGSLIGGIKETQEMLDYSVEHKIYPRVEIIEPSRITEAYKKVLDGEVQFRYVIDMFKLK